MRCTGCLIKPITVFGVRTPQNSAASREAASMRKRFGVIIRDKSGWHSPSTRQRPCETTRVLMKTSSLALLAFFSCLVGIQAASISTHPAGQSIAHGGSGTLSVVASGTGTLTYQWQKDGINIVGATGSTLTIPNMRPWHVGDYSVLVTDTGGTVTSNAAEITIPGINTGVWKGLTHYYPFDGNTSDLGPSQNDFVNTNAIVAADRLNRPSGSYAFDGNTAWMVTEENLPVSGSAPRTFAFWMRAENRGHFNGSPNILAHGTKISTGDLFSITLSDTATNRHLFVHGSWLDTGMDGMSVLPLESWLHVVVATGGTTADSTFFINGAAVNTVSNSSGTFNTTLTKLRISTGSDSGGISNDSFIWWNAGFKGRVDEVRVYNRKLASNEVLALYEAEGAEIAVEQPSGTDLVDGVGASSWSATQTGGTGVPITYTIKNLGTANLTNLAANTSGANAGDYTIGSLGSTTLVPGGSTTFTVIFSPTPGATGPRTASLRISSNDLDENPFDIALSGAAYSTTIDFDSDGMSDWGEFKLVALGFDWQVANTALVTALYTNADAAGLFTASQVQNLNVETPLIQRNPASGEFTLIIGLEKSPNVSTWNPFPVTAPQTSVNGQGKVELRFNSPDSAAFFRLRAQ